MRHVLIDVIGFEWMKLQLYKRVWSIHWRPEELLFKGFKGVLCGGSSKERGLWLESDERSATEACSFRGSTRTPCSLDLRSLFFALPNIYNVTTLNCSLDMVAAC